MVTESQEQEKKQETSNAEAIISGIEADARTEEQQIIQEAESQAAEKKKYTEKKIESLLKDAQKEASEHAEAVKKKILSGMQIELKRRSMNIHNFVMRDTLSKTEKKLYSMIDDTNYRNILIDWITEAAIGLGVDSARINASEKERVLINDELISQATEKIRAKTNKTITLQLSDDLPLKYQGIVLTSADGRTAFNNQIKTRMSRKEREIRMTIYNTLFTDERKE